MNPISVHLYRDLPNIGPRDIGALPPSVISKVQHGETMLKAIREWRGLSQADLADRTGIAITQIQRAERGGDISPEVMRGLARGLRVRDDIFPEPD